MTEKEAKAVEYYQDKEISFSVDFDTKKLLEALGITEEDSFENHQIRFRTLLNLIQTQQKALEQKDKEIQELKADLYECNNIISDYIDTVKEKDKMIDLFKRRIFITENEHKEILKIQEKFLEKDFQDCLIIYFQKKARKENE